MPPAIYLPDRLETFRAQGFDLEFQRRAVGLVTRLLGAIGAFAAPSADIAVVVEPLEKAARLPISQ
jgi:hypothetical protein